MPGNSDKFVLVFIYYVPIEVISQHIFDTIFAIIKTGGRRLIVNIVEDRQKNIYTPSKFSDYQNSYNKHFFVDVSGCQLKSVIKVNR